MIWPTPTLARLLCQHNLLSPEQAAIAEEYARLNHIPFISSVVKHEFIDSETILNWSAAYFKLSIIKLDNYDTSLLHDSMIETSMLERHHVLPIKKNPHSLQLAISDPTDQAALAAMRFHTGLNIEPVLVDERELDYMIQTYCRPTILYSQLKQALSRINSPINDPGQIDNDQASEEPVIQFVNQLLEDALRKNVSDIHIEAFKETCRVRFRRDGILHEAATLPHHFATRIVTRLKIMANLDITEKRLPQDGRFHFEQREKLDLRVSTCPALHGENIALRLLRPASQNILLEELGLSTEQLTDLYHALHHPQGLILVTGPTGSGKTATLYSALHYLNQPEKKILTVEDPVEIDMTGITQVNVNARIGLNFATVLRSFLRQDPDIMMVGEIRDNETAAIAVQAAQTGHLVLATLHANSAIDSIKRLLALGITSYQLAGALTMLAAQRLVRRLCTHCQPSSGANQTLGCEHCCHGYKGRTGIFEIYPVSSCTTQLLLANAPLAQIEHQFLIEHPQTLFECGLKKIKDGITSNAELFRVTGGPHA